MSNFQQEKALKVMIIRSNLNIVSPNLHIMKQLLTKMSKITLISY